MNPTSIRTLFGYTYWAFDLVWECIAQLSDEQFLEEINYSTGSIRNHVVHLMSGTNRWVKRLQGDDVPPHLYYEDFTTRDAVRARWDILRDETLAYVAGLDQKQLNETIPWELPARGLKLENRRWEILQHVANHATDHRSQMLAMLNTRFGIKTVEQDMLFYLLEIK